MSSSIQRSMAGGEIAPALYARADQNKYATGLRTCLNYMIMRHGGATNRAGTRFIGATRTLGKRVRQIRFVFNDAQAYVLEFGDFYLRVIRNGGYVLAKAATPWSNVTNYFIGDTVTFGGLTYAANVFSNNKQPDVNPPYWQLLTNGIYERSTPYAEADLQTLRYEQSNDVITITHQNYKPRDYGRLDHNVWSESLVQLDGTILGPVVLFTAGGAGGEEHRYVVTSVAAESYEESTYQNVFGSAALAAPTSAAPHVVDWTPNPVPNAGAYNVYKGTSTGAFGFLAQVVGTVYKDRGLVIPDYSVSPPLVRSGLFSTDYPKIVFYFQQRLGFGGTPLEPLAIWTSRSASRGNFMLSYPSREDDSIKFTLRGQAELKHILEIDANLIVLTAQGEVIIEGDVNGVLTPASVNPRKFGGDGASDVRPVLVNKTAIYIQARGNIMRDLRYEVSSTDGKTTYRGRDLSLFADHLFKGYTITDMAFQKVPHSIVWAVRSDGVLIGLTYLPDQEIWGFHRHVTDGVVENICCIPEGDEDALYLVVKRTIGGVAYRYVERMASRRVTDIAIDAFFVDSGLSYDGRNTGAGTMTLSTGAGWTVADTITVTSSVVPFSAGDVGNEVVLRIGTDELRIRITVFVDPAHVTGTPSKDVPAAFRGVATANWGKAVDDLSGLSHLEGKTVAVLADGVVEAQQVVVDGAIHLQRPYEIIHVGLPYVADLETLDLEVIGQPTISDKKKRVNSLTLFLQETRGVRAGPDADHLRELPLENALYHNPSAYEREKVEISLNSTYNDHGRVLMRQADPLPSTILSVVPSGFIGG